MSETSNEPTNPDDERETPDVGLIADEELPEDLQPTEDNPLAQDPPEDQAPDSQDPDHRDEA
jgi:hypothetical protein